MEGLISISDREFNDIAKLVYENFGINLTDKKRTLVRGRLNKTIHQLGFRSFKDYYSYVVSDKTGRGLIDLIDKISTNHSFFFRENEHFEFFREVTLAEYDGRKETPEMLRIWSAGCANGEEPYTLAMVLAERYGIDAFLGRKVILATDISLTALGNASAGLYSEERLKNVPKYFLKKYFAKVDAETYQVLPALKRLILFKRLNFMDPHYPFRGRFHAVFCRNVMIYFDTDTKRELVRKFHRHGTPHTYLFIGHSESLGRDMGEYQFIRPSIYRMVHS